MTLQMFLGFSHTLSDNLLMFRTKKLRPEYRDNYAPAPTQHNKVTIVHNYHPSVLPPPSAAQGTEAKYRALPEAAEGEYRDIPEATEEAQE